MYAALPERSRHPVRDVEKRAGLVLARLGAWRRERLGGLSRTGLVVAGGWLVGANTPSLLPRPWWLQGLIAAICALLGYVVGLLIGALGRAVLRWLGLQVSADPRRTRLLARIGWGLLAFGVLLFPSLTIGWQRSVTAYVGLPAPGWAYPLGSTVVALVVFVVGISLWRLVAGLLDWFLARVRSRIVAETTARVVASALTVVTVVALITWVLSPALMAAVQDSAERVDRTSPAGHVAPTSALRSGGPGSPYPWSSLGQDGATFVASGPDAAAIGAVTHRAAKEPIRVFVGQHPEPAQTVNGVLAELDRTRAWERRSLLLVTATSTGYINTWGAASFEYLQDGDTAIASLAYSNLPSAFGLLTARDQPVEATKALVAAVRGRLAAMPAATRPKLYVTGESLGAYGGEGAFASLDDMVARTDGAVWSGTPEFAPNLAALTAARDNGSTTIDPVVARGARVRFAGDAAQLWTDEYDRPLGAWSHPRVVYLQHPSDPVAWWSPSLIFSSPEWLRETRRDTPMAQMNWLPLVTFWQVSADMLVSNNVPGGFGHRYYGAEMVPAWAAVLGLDPPAATREAMIEAVGRS